MKGTENEKSFGFFTKSKSQYFLYILPKNWLELVQLMQTMDEYTQYEAKGGMGQFEKCKWKNRFV